MRVVLMTLLLVGCGTSPTESVLEAQGKSNCAHCCVATFPPGPERGMCMSEAAHGYGPCICNHQCCIGARDLAVPPPPIDLSLPGGG